MEVNMDRSLDRHKEKMYKVIDNEVTALFEIILNYAEVALTNKYQYDKFRSKVLKAGNECKRNLKNKVRKDFDIRFIGTSEDLIEVIPYDRKQSRY
jgi:hypothetical protein